MGWLSWYVGYNKKRKDIVINEVIDTKNYGIVHIEEKGSNVWLITRDMQTNKMYGNLFLTSYKNGEFGYKAIGIEAHPFYYNCSKKIYELCKEIYGNSDCKYAKEWLENWQKETQLAKQKTNIIKSLKIGDIIEFENDGYGKKQWKISRIDGAKILFEGYNLVGWKKQNFKKVIV